MKKSILLLALCCFTISNAQRHKKIKGNEIIKTIKRTTSEFDKIKASGSFDIKLVAGKEGSITIKGDENLLQYIKTEVKNTTLTVAFEKGTNIQYNYSSSIEIIIPIEKISEIEFSGSGNVSTLDALNSDNLNVEIKGSGNAKFETNSNNLKITRSGSGNLSAKGKATTLDIISTGSGNVNTSELISENVTASQSGSGNIKVNCTDSLSATSSGSGSIIYKGSPKKVQKSSTGSGSISGN